MKKNQILFLIFGAVFLFSLQVVAQTETPSPKAVPAQRLDRARELADRGSYLQAQEIYQSLLKDEALGEQKTTVRQESESLKIKLLFSSTKTPDSLWHTVAAGDTLYDLAKKYGTTIELLKKSNHLTGDKILSGKKLKVTRNRFSILVEKKRNRLTLLADGKPMKHYRVATGEKGSTPAGTFKIVNKVEHPTWYHDGKAIPPDDPKNILGSHWLGFDLPGYGIHGTTLPETIGTQASQGCVRMYDAEVEEIFILVPPGTSVTVKE